MIDLEAFNFLYDYEHLTALQKQELLADLAAQSAQVLSLVTQAAEQLPQQAALFLAQVHQAKSAALVLCSDPINHHLAKMNKTPLSLLEQPKNEIEIFTLSDLILAYQNELNLLKVFIN